MTLRFAEYTPPGAQQQQLTAKDTIKEGHLQGHLDATARTSRSSLRLNNNKFFCLRLLRANLLGDSADLHTVLAATLHLLGAGRIDRAGWRALLSGAGCMHTNYFAAKEFRCHLESIRCSVFLDVDQRQHSAAIALRRKTIASSAGIELHVWLVRGKASY